MKRKELKNIAQKIAKLEQKLLDNPSAEARIDVEAEIMELSSNLHNLEDMMAIDEMVQEILQKSK